MSYKPLTGKKVAILTETEFIAKEMDRYETRFTELGAEVHVMSRLWGQGSITFVSDVDEIGARPVLRTVHHDFMKVNVEDYAAVLMSANYTSIRLSYFETPPGTEHKWAELTDTAPAVQFFAEAMENPKIVKGALCHGLFILAPRPDLLRGRRVTCHKVVLANIVNAGATFAHSPTGVVVDDDLVTGYSADDVDQYIDEIAKCVQQKSGST